MTRLVSLNAWGGAMFDELAAWLALDDTDVYCFQEITRTPGLGGWTQYDDPDRSLPQRANLFADLCQALPDHVGHFQASDAGPVTSDNGATHLQEFGLATFVHRRLQLVAETGRFVHGGYVEHRAWPSGGRPRVAQAVRLVADGRPFIVVNLHGLRDPAGKSDTPERLTQARRLVKFIVETRGTDDHTLVCGDFNVLPDSSTFDILGEIGLTDLVGAADTRTSRYRKPNRHANYLLVSSPEQVIAFEALAEPEVSDHRILTLTL